MYDALTQPSPELHQPRGPSPDHWGLGPVPPEQSKNPTPGEPDTGRAAQLRVPASPCRSETRQMTMKLYDDECLIEGRYRLRRLRREAARADPARILAGRACKEASAVRKALPHWNLDNLAAALLYPVEGGWNADVLLREAPEGQPVILDRGEGQPFATRREAEAFLTQFAMVLAATWAPEQVLPPKVSVKSGQQVSRLTNVAERTKIMPSEL